MSYLVSRTLYTNNTILNFYRRRLDGVIIRSIDTYFNLTIKESNFKNAFADFQ